MSIGKAQEIRLEAANWRSRVKSADCGPQVLETLNSIAAP